MNNQQRRPRSRPPQRRPSRSQAPGHNHDRDRSPRYRERSRSRSSLRPRPQPRAPTRDRSSPRARSRSPIRRKTSRPTKSRSPSRSSPRRCSPQPPRRHDRGDNKTRSCHSPPSSRRHLPPPERMRSMSRQRSIKIVVNRSRSKSRTNQPDQRREGHDREKRSPEKKRSESRHGTSRNSKVDKILSKICHARQKFDRKNCGYDTKSSTSSESEHRNSSSVDFTVRKIPKEEDKINVQILTTQLSSLVFNSSSSETAFTTTGSKESSTSASIPPARPKCYPPILSLKDSSSPKQYPPPPKRPIYNRCRSVENIRQTNHPTLLPEKSYNRCRSTENPPQEDHNSHHQQGTLAKESPSRPAPPSKLTRHNSTKMLSSGDRPSPHPPPPPRRNKAAAVSPLSVSAPCGLDIEESFNESKVSTESSAYLADNEADLYASPPINTASAIVVSSPPALTNSNSKLLSKNQRSNQVTNMPYTDAYGDAGMYTGEIEPDSRLPHGKGKMKYENGVFYEGKWINGSQDSAAIVNRDRMLSGFTSWKGQTKNKDKNGNGDGRRNVYGMEWVDLKGNCGRYTGSVNNDDTPDGKGVMKYDFGLIAEGDWIKGRLNDGQNPYGMAAAGGATVVGGGTVAPGGQSVFGGGMSCVSGLGMMSIGGTGQMVMMNQGYPNMMVGQLGAAQMGPQFSYAQPGMMVNPMLGYGMNHPSAGHLPAGGAIPTTLTIKKDGD